LPPYLVRIEARSWRTMAGADRDGPPGEVDSARLFEGYVRGNKNDAVDAAAIARRWGWPNMRFVALREVENQAQRMRHRAREPSIGCTC
jgi:hypothetical protein